MVVRLKAFILIGLRAKQIWEGVWYECYCRGLGSYSAVYYTCSQQAANGVIFQVTFPTGKPCMPTIKFGGKWTRMTPVFSKKCIKKLVETYREQDGRKKQTSFCIVDAQSVKNTWTAGEKGYDAGKKVSGIKRHIAVDTNGLIHAIQVTTANITDREGAIKMCEKYKKALDKVTNILCDGGYTGPSFAQSIKEAINCSVEVIKRSELHKFVVLPKRWIVERTFAWLENYRRL